MIEKRSGERRLCMTLELCQASDVTRRQGGQAQTYPSVRNMTETPSPPSITVEGGERVQFSAQVESQAVAGQTGGVGGSAAQGGRA
jgi:hypothetical protein